MSTKYKYNDHIPNDVVSELMIPHPKSEALKHARGQRWVRLLREVYADVAPVLADEARAIIKAKDGKITPFDVATIAVRHNLHFKHACEWLEEQRVLPTGTYTKLHERGFRFRDAMKEAVRGACL